MSAAIEVQPLTKDRIIIRLSEGYTPIVFKLANGGAEVIVLDRGGTEATRLAVAPPERTQKLEVSILGSGHVDVSYSDK